MFYRHRAWLRGAASASSQQWRVHFTLLLFFCLTGIKACSGCVCMFVYSCVCPPVSPHSFESVPVSLYVRVGKSWLWFYLSPLLTHSYVAFIYILWAWCVVAFVLWSAPRYISIRQCYSPFTSLISAQYEFISPPPVAERR